MSALSDQENVQLVVIDEDTDTGFTEDEAYAVLTGQYRSGIVAASDPLDDLPNAEAVDVDVDPGYADTTDGLPDDDAESGEQPPEKHTGAMIALVPSDLDLERLPIPGGEAREELHLTLWFLGNNADYPEALRAQIVSEVMEICLEQSPISVTGFGAALWNPTSDTPSANLSVGGEGLEEAREAVGTALEELWAACIPEQHCPWVPHVCLAYTSDQAGVAQDILDRCGPITFDKIRVAFGDVVTDVPLGYSNAIITASVNTGAHTMPYDVRKSDSCPSDKPYGIFKKDGGKQVGGCHASQEDAQAQIAAIHANEGAAVDGVSLAAGENDPPVSGVGAVGNTNLPGTVPPGVSFQDNGTAWEGVLVVEGTPTGDGRQFAAGSLTWATPPIPLRWAPQDYGEHAGAVDVGRIDEVWRDPAQPNYVMGRGVFNTGDPVAMQAFTNVQTGFLSGVSVDVDSVKDADVELVFPPDGGESMDDIGAMLFGPAPDLTIFHAGRIRGATLVSLPAFVEAKIHLMDTAAMPTASPAPSGTGGKMPMKPDMSLDEVVLQLGKLLTDSSLGYDLGERRMRHASLASYLNESWGLVAPPFSEDALSDEVRAALVAAPVDAYVAPPAAWFVNPQLEGPTALTVTDDGRVFGHAALWGTCHIGFPDACVTPPQEDFHDQFLLGEIVTVEGQHFAIGGITLGTGHAPTFGVSAKEAVEHYDNTGTRVADVVVGNDAHGIWVAGAVRPGTPAGRVAELRAAKLSGDWRRLGGRLRLVALLAVNVPGFPVPRLQTRITAGSQLSLVAAGIVPDDIRDPAETRAMRAMKDRLASRIGRDAASKKAALRARIHNKE